MMKWVLGVSAAVLVAALAAAGWLYFDYRSFVRAPLDVQPPGYILEVTPGTSLKTLAGQLQEAGLIRHPVYLEWLGRTSGQASRIQVGEFRITPGMTPPDLLARLASGQVVQHAFTIIAGWTFDQLRRALGEQNFLVHTLEGLPDSAVMTRLGEADRPPEGLFLPDTYHFPRGTADREVLKRAMLAMQQYLSRVWPKRDEGLPLDTAYEALILASIVEKETGLASERPAIAGVFIRRLEKGMRLQTDPTVIYGLGEAFDGNLRRRDLRTDTPYNTYTRKGLPPTPIAMPSRAAIDAVLHPASGDALYFVSRGDGSHEFSATLQEHNEAVRRYQLGR